MARAGREWGRNTTRKESRGVKKNLHVAGAEWERDRRGAVAPMCGAGAGRMTPTKSLMVRI
jgi:hypothetical protein